MVSMRDMIWPVRGQTTHASSPQTPVPPHRAQGSRHQVSLEQSTVQGSVLFTLPQRWYPPLVWGKRGELVQSFVCSL